MTSNEFGILMKYLFSFYDPRTDWFITEEGAYTDLSFEQYCKYYEIKEAILLDTKDKEFSYPKTP